MSDSNEFLTRLLGEASGGKVKLISGKDLADLLDGKPGALRDILGDKVEDCGHADCPIHGTNPDIITDDILTAMTADDMDANALSATAAAHNALIRKQYGKAMLFQNQAQLWTEEAAKERNRLAGQKLRESAASETEADAVS